MSQTSGRRCGFPVPMRWLHAGGDLSRPNHIHQSADRSLMRSADAEMPTALSRPRVRADIEVASCWRAAHHRHRRQHKISIALAAQPVPNFPRLRALALFGRRPAQSAEPLVVAGVQKPAQKPTLAKEGSNADFRRLDLPRPLRALNLRCLKLLHDNKGSTQLLKIELLQSVRSRVEQTQRADTTSIIKRQGCPA